MLFNSPEFPIFLILVFALYWFAFKNLVGQNILLLFASYCFYGWWDWRFVLLLAASTLIDYSFGLWLSKAKNGKKAILVLGIVNNLSVLFAFKYFNFFSASFAAFLNLLGLNASPVILDIILPVGISFYTFHGMSYMFDVYFGKITPTKNLINYSVFVCFFPLLVAGPIERASHLLPQIEKPRIFNESIAVAGLRLILWGLFVKVVIADSLAPIVDEIFDGYHYLSAPTLILGSVLFAIQIYGDFSGYSAIARGVARLFGFELLVNFRFPYFSRDIAEFWRRWHISLSSWFRDYLYIPLGGSKRGVLRVVLNTFIIFIVSGFWHGAKWNFILWGFLHALYFLPLLLSKKNRVNTDEIVPGGWLPSPKIFLKMVFTFMLVCFAWIFFRAENLTVAVGYIKSMFVNGMTSTIEGPMIRKYTIVLILLFFLVEWFSRNSDVDKFFGRLENKYVRRGSYFLIAILIVLFGSFNENSFIYFQF